MSLSHLQLEGARPAAVEQPVSDVFGDFGHSDMSREQPLNRVELLLLNESLYFRFTE